jgi:hypothetical protein
MGEHQHPAICVAIEFYASGAIGFGFHRLRSIE